jgi:hypothetical protein
MSNPGDLWTMRLSDEEFERRLAMARLELENGEELENLQALIAWFQRRYPTAYERLAYNRRKNPQRPRSK